MHLVELRVFDRDAGENGKEVTVETRNPGERPGGLEDNDENGKRFYYVWWCLPDGSESRIFKSKKEVHTLEEESNLRDIVEKSVKLTANASLELTTIFRDPDPTLPDLQLVTVLNHQKPASLPFFIKPDSHLPHNPPRTLHITFRHSKECLTPNNP